jgi:hypothetical protein
MSGRFVKGKARTETPRAKDIPACLIQTAYETGEERSVGRGEGGRVGPGNRLAVGSGFKAQIRRSLGNPDDPATGPLVKEALKMYASILRDLPDTGPQVRPLVAAQARHTVLATHYANLAVKAGLDTAAGMALADAARAHDTTAQRLSTTAFDRAVRMAAVRGRSGPSQTERVLARLRGEQP